jgi:hypothetical protein
MDKWEALMWTRGVVLAVCWTACVHPAPDEGVATTKTTNPQKAMEARRALWNECLPVVRGVYQDITIEGTTFLECPNPVGMMEDLHCAPDILAKYRNMDLAVDKSGEAQEQVSGNATSTQGAKTVRVRSYTRRDGTYVKARRHLCEILYAQRPQEIISALVLGGALVSRRGTVTLPAH